MMVKNELVKNILEMDGVDIENADLADLLSSHTVSKDINKLHRQSLTVGDKAADRFAGFAGSWRFIIGFGIIMALWILFNQITAVKFDAYPFILLNLVLSCIAAIQAPVIMMSQNRQEEKDRLQARNQYRINIKSELMIKELNNKLNRLLDNQARIEKLIEGSKNNPSNG